MRRLTHLLLLLALLWQAVLPLSASERTQHWLHGDLHASLADHHHHHDGSIHEEDSGGASQHVHPGFDLGSAVILNAGWRDAGPVSSRALPAAPRPSYAGPCLAGPLRPPQHA